MSKIVNVKYEKKESNNILIFSFKKPIILNLTSNNNEDILSFFESLLNELYSDHDVQFELEKVDEPDLFYDASQKYIEDLNTEIKNIEWPKWPND